MLRRAWCVPQGAEEGWSVEVGGIAKTTEGKLGDPIGEDIDQGPQVDKIQVRRSIRAVF